jgi:carboxymethylenebutenolidase
MRVPLTAALTLALLATSALGQIGVRGRIQDKINDAVEQHNQDVENMLNGGNPPAPQVAPQPGDLKTGWLTRKSKGDGKEVRLYFAYPATLTKAKKAPAILVLQEWWGVNDDIQERTREFASKGFYAVAPDLYYGKVTDDPAQAAQLKQSMTDAAAMTAMKTGLDLIQEEVTNGIVDNTHVAAIGWCMGGQQSLLLSVNDPRIKATALFYGPLVTDAEKLKNLKGPVLAVFGNNDTAPSPADVDKFKAGLKAAGKTDVTIYQFDGVGHAFASKSAAKMGAYNEEKAKDAWAKTWEWLDQKLPRK